MHAFHLSMLREKIGDLHRVFGMRAHSPRHRAHPAQDQPAIERRGDGAAGILNRAHAFKKFVVGLTDDDSTEHVAMAAKVFGRGMKNEIGAEIERPLNRRCPGIVANRQRASLANNFRNRGKIEGAVSGASDLGKILAQMPGIAGRAVMLLERMDGLTRNGLQLSPESIEALGRAEQRHSRWLTAGIWLIGIALVVAVWILR